MNIDTAPQDVTGDTPFMVEDLDQFITILSDWHEHAVASVRHMLEVPEGIEVAIVDENIPDDEGKQFKLEGDAYTGFKLGIELALGQLGALPFKEYEGESVH